MCRMASAAKTDDTELRAMDPGRERAVGVRADPTANPAASPSCASQRAGVQARILCHVRCGDAQWPKGERSCRLRWCRAGSGETRATITRSSSATPGQTWSRSRSSTDPATRYSASDLPGGISDARGESTPISHAPRSGCNRSGSGSGGHRLAGGGATASNGASCPSHRRLRRSLTSRSGAAGNRELSGGFRMVGRPGREEVPPRPATRSHSPQLHPTEGPARHTPRGCRHHPGGTTRRDRPGCSARTRPASRRSAGPMSGASPTPPCKLVSIERALRSPSSLRRANRSGRPRQSR